VPRIPAHKQLTHTAAILALAVLCAQTVGVVHDHHHISGPDHYHVSAAEEHHGSEAEGQQASDTENCAVCAAPTQHADNSSSAAASTTRFAQRLEPGHAPEEPIVRTSSASLARAPPTN
jgi:hypothetical protein